MARLSLHRLHKSNDYKFIDKIIYEQFQVGGAIVYVHKYIGPVDPSDPNKALGETSIQDVVFLSNRDRKYDQTVFTIRGHYQVQDTDFNLSQFGLFLQNDTVFMTVHINNSVDLIGRKIMSGDVIELPNLIDEYALNDFTVSLKRFYVVDDVTRAAEGYSATWYPHLYRLKLKPLVDSQEFRDILEKPLDDDIYAGIWDPDTIYYPGQVVKYNGELYMVNTDGSVSPNGTTIRPPDSAAWHLYTDLSLKDVMSTYNKELELSNLVNMEAELDAPKSGYETAHFYTLAVTDKGDTMIRGAESGDNVASDTTIDIFNDAPIKDGYSGYLLPDGIPPNAPLQGYLSSQFGYGLKFPERADDGDYFLRTDYFPNRLFRFDKNKWVRQEDNVRMELSNTDTRQTLKTSFINNKQTTGLGRIVSDVVLVDDNGNIQYESGDDTAFFELRDSSAYFILNLEYNNSYNVEVWLDEDAKAYDITTSNANGSLAFTINHPIPFNTRIRYTVFSRVIEQRQFPSKALKRIKPEADNF